jgi:hypothetical protein
MNYSDIQQFTNPDAVLSGHAAPGKYIYRLINSLYFFLDMVLIVIEEEYYRLIVYDRVGNSLTDKRYSTVKGARIAFMRFFRHKYYNDNPGAEWSIAYPPDADWLEEIETLIALLPASCKNRTVNKTKVKNEDKGNCIKRRKSCSGNRGEASIHQGV